MRLQSYISDEKVIDLLCRDRIKQAINSNDFEYVGRLLGTRGHEKTNALGKMLPPRRKWSQFRPRYRSRIAEVDLISLKLATKSLRYDQPQEGWVRALNEFIERVRLRVLGNQQFEFGRPVVKWQIKEENKYRALCCFSLEDNLVIRLVARYIRDFCDTAFEDSSFAFRARSLKGGVLTHHSAFEKIHQLRVNAPDKDLFVAECDIRGFYDSVEHTIALDAFSRVVRQVQNCRPGLVLDPRVQQIYRAFLNCYSFPDNVLGEAIWRLKSQDPNGCFPWPEDSLSRFYANPRSQRIGISQGGALSCVIANLVLDYADKHVEAAKASVAGGDLHYFRFCDDMILLGSRKAKCHEVFRAYLDALEELKLPYHRPKSVILYDRKFWEGKSKAPYCWTGRKGLGCVPWVQFVGYQIRYDGLVRVKKKSVEKQIAKVWELTDRLKYGLLKANSAHEFPKPFDPPSVLASRGQVFSSLRRKLVAMSVGRVKPQIESDGPLPRCWANGFKGLHKKPIVPTFLSQLDRNREREVRRVGRAPIAYGPGRPSRRKRMLGQTTGYQFSYAAQFENAGGKQLIRAAYNSSSWNGAVLGWFCTLWKDRQKLMRRSMWAIRRFGRRLGLIAESKGTNQTKQ